MLKKNIKPVLLAGALALATAVSPVLAADSVKDENGNTVTITKTVEWAYGATFDGGVKFNVTKVTTDAPVATISYGNQATSLNFTNTEGTLNNFGTDSKTKNATLSFGTFPHAGEYVYTVTEVDDDDTANSTLTKKAETPDSYKIRVYVKNEGNGLAIDYITAAVLNSDGNESNKVDSVVFNNEYKESADLTISKSVDGSYADKTKDFTFKITLTAPEISDISNPVYKDNEKKENGTSITGRIGENETITIECGVESDEIYLHDGEQLVFENLPVGTKFEVTEVGAEDGYTPSVTVVASNVETSYSIKNTENLVTDASNATGKGIVVEQADGASNTVAFVNKYNDNIRTGVIINNMPYIALLGASGAGLVVLAASKKRSK